MKEEEDKLMISTLNPTSNLELLLSPDNLEDIAI